MIDWLMERYKSQNMYEGTTSPMFWPCSLTPTIVFLQSIPWPKLKRFPHPQCQVKSASCWGFTDSNMYVSCWFLVDMGRIGEACYQPFSFWDKCDTRWCRGIWRWWHYQQQQCSTTSSDFLQQFWQTPTPQSLTRTHYHFSAWIWHIIFQIVVEL